MQSVRRDESNTEKDLHSLHVRAVSLDPACRSDLVLVPADLVLVRPLSQCYFLNFGNADIPVLYSVQRLRDGRSYSTRSVLATQQGVPIFTLTCSFCLPEPKQPVRALPLPHWPLRWHRTEEDKAQRKDLGDSIPEPEDCDATEEVMLKALAAGKNLPKKLQDLCVLLPLQLLEVEHQTLTAVLPAASSAKPRSAGSRRSSCATPTGASLPSHSLAASRELTSLLHLAGAKQGSSSASSGPPRSSASSLVFPSPPPHPSLCASLTRSSPFAGSSTGSARARQSVPTPISRRCVPLARSALLEPERIMLTLSLAARSASSPTRPTSTSSARLRARPGSGRRPSRGSACLRCVRTPSLSVASAAATGDQS